MVKRSTYKREDEDGYYIYRAYITTKDGKRIYPRKSKCFRIWIAK